MITNEDYRRYRDHIKTTAKEIFEDSQNAQILPPRHTAEDYITETLHERAQDNEFIIYTNQNQIVIEASNPKHEPDPDDVAIFHTGTDTAGDWRAIRETAAFLTMREELAEAIEDLKLEAKLKEAAAQD
jgi:ADP-glucose pyrophosphorylase